MDLDKKAEEKLEETYNEHKHRMSDWVHNSTKDMVIDAIKKALTIPVVIVPKGSLCKCGKEYLVYNDREGLNVCTLCGKSELA